MSAAEPHEVGGRPTHSVGAWPTDDDALRAVLHAVDPAAPGKAPDVDPRSVEDAMSQVSTTPESVTPAPARRRWLAAAAAVVLAGGVGYATLGRPDPTPPLTFTVAASDPTAMCLAIDVAMTKQADVAFDGTVTAVSDGTATLSVAKWFKGGNGATTVHLTAPTGTETALLGTVNPELGKRYLIVAADGAIQPCSAAGEWSPDLQAHFTAAFGS